MAQYNQLGIYIVDQSALDSLSSAKVAVIIVGSSDLEVYQTLEFEL